MTVKYNWFDNVIINSLKSKNSYNIPYLSEKQKASFLNYCQMLPLMYGQRKAAYEYVSKDKKYKATIREIGNNKMTCTFTDLKNSQITDLQIRIDLCKQELNSGYNFRNGKPTKNKLDNEDIEELNEIIQSLESELRQCIS